MCGNVAFGFEFLANRWKCRCSQSAIPVRLFVRLFALFVCFVCLFFSLFRFVLVYFVLLVLFVLFICVCSALLVMLGVACRARRCSALLVSLRCYLALLGFVDVACLAWRCLPLLALLVVLGVVQRCLFLFGVN